MTYLIRYDRVGGTFFAESKRASLTGVGRNIHSAIEDLELQLSEGQSLSKLNQKISRKSLAGPIILTSVSIAAAMVAIGTAIMLRRNRRSYSLQLMEPENRRLQGAEEPIPSASFSAIEPLQAVPTVVG